MNTLEKPLEQEDLDYLLEILERTPGAECEAKHQLTYSDGERVSMGPCGHDAVYRAYCPEHDDSAWHHGKNVCAKFYWQVRMNEDRFPLWTFIPI